MVRGLNFWGSGSW